MQKNLVKHLPKIVSIVILVAVVLGYFLIPEMKDFMNEAWSVLSSGDEQKIENWVSSFGWAGPVVLILAMIAQMFLIVIPSVALMVVCILAYGPVWGSLLVLVAVSSASSVGYILGKKLGSGLINNLIGSSTETKLEDFIEDYGFWAIAITRLNPFLSNDAISFVGGILKMNYFKFLAATLAGIAPLTLFIAIMGQSTSGMKSGLLWGSVISLVIFCLYVYWSKKRKKKKS
ncbi:TVP38/TMEM64 family protein [Leeuwenhoekiella polynyae]|uniref:TVP38/TMEM64 family membrane protein n=1 Tax=Leeuwenhoekiella polynyae TaxID=1550906 RepID=A0A4Q0NSI0_9FLAO|nr:VTT domain-containing protein [Leeuwenhoekiella polynyae]RXG13660.1 putative membrane protein YdjX (TVP38/TMEM64 family) [Leeuwenhoekiella polynyae]